LLPASRAQEILSQNARDWHNQKNYGGQRDQGSSFHCKSQISMNETQSDTLNPGLPMLDFHSNKSDNIVSILNPNISPEFSDHDKSWIRVQGG
jgi:hypothetical protein